MSLQISSLKRNQYTISTSDRNKKRKKVVSHSVGKKGTNDKLVAECLRMWEKEKKAREKLSTLTILKVKEWSENDELKVSSVKNPQFQELTQPPCINMLEESSQMLSSSNSGDDSLVSSFNRTKNVFRVKLSTISSKLRSIQTKSTKEDNVNQLNISFKSIETRSVQRQKKMTSIRKAEHNFLETKLRRKVYPIRFQAVPVHLEVDLMSNSDFILSPW